MPIIRFFGLKNQLNRVKTSICITIWLLFSIYTVPGLAANGQNTTTDPASESAIKSSRFLVTVKDASEFKDMLAMTKKIVSSARLFEYLNEVFKEHLTISPEQQQLYGWPSKTKVLSETQIVFILKTLKSLPNYDELMGLINEYLTKNTEFKAEDPLRSEFIASLKKQFEAILNEGKTVSALRGLNDPSKTLTIEYSDGRVGFEEATIHFNRPRYIDPKNKSKGTIEAEDLKQLVIQKIRNAKSSISINIFEFNLIDVALELEKAILRGVKVRVGVDKNTTRLAPENIAVTAKLIELHRRHRELMKFTLVNPTGLNHQKVFVFDSGTKDAETVFSSGNLTQSCIGPEGDVLNADRPKTSKPNANHTVVSKGELAAAVVEHELDKTLDQKLRGQNEQSGYPISGSYSFSGDTSAKTGKVATLNIAFSPNGGMGNLASSIFRPILLQSQGQIYLWQFVASAPVLLDTLAEVAKNDPSKFDFRGSFDPPFAMQSFSISLKMSGFTRDKITKLYLPDPNEQFSKILSPEQMRRLQNNIRLNTKAYGEYHYPNEIKVTVKQHNKIVVLPRINLAFVGTSFNLSLSAEGNQENLMWITNHSIVDQTESAFLYEMDQTNTTVTKQTAKRNAVIDDPLLQKIELEKRDSKTARSGTIEKTENIVETRSAPSDLESRQMNRDELAVPSNQCLRVYLKK